MKHEKLKGFVPAEPIRLAVEEALEKLGTKGHHNVGNRHTVLMAPVSVLASELALYSGRSLPTCHRLLYGIRNGTISSAGKRHPRKFVRFDVADDILCCIGQPWRWYTDPELAEAYRDVA